VFKRRKPNELNADGSDSPPPASAASPPAEADDEFPLEAFPTDFASVTDALLAESPDSGLGVPPFRPIPIKDALPMSRPPSFSPVNPAAPPAPAPTATARPGLGAPRPPGRDPAERRTLVVGRGISVQGTVQDAERLVVEGTVEASMIHATELSIAPGGIFKGEVEVEDAEIAGTIDGTLVARGAMVVRATGRVLGTARCRRLQVEDGGQITGRIEMITEPASAEAAPKPATEPVV
jgi:cytoskeletal protein CcmA (bactofilin family)